MQNFEVDVVRRRSRVSIAAIDTLAVLRDVWPLVHSGAHIHRAYRGTLCWELV